MSKKIEFMDIGTRQREVEEWKHARRIALREEYLKRYHHPTKYMHIDDPAIQKFNSLKMNYNVFFKPTFWNFLTFVGAFAAIVGLAKHVTIHKEKREKLIRTGQIPYSDREQRFQ